LTLIFTNKKEEGHLDTGTHIAMGIAVGGLSTLDPVIANDPATAQGVFVAVLIGSNAPDFDTILKLKNNAVFIRNHRGITHSIPALFIWPLLISGAILLFYPNANFYHLLLWTFLSVFLHVFVDLFNAYGTQAMSPISGKWVAFGVINIFDPLIFISHLIGIGLWFMGIHPGYTFLTIYTILIFYYLIRVLSKLRIIKMVQKEIPEVTSTIVSPSIRWGQWHLAIQTAGNFYVAEVKNRNLIILDKYKRLPVPDIPVITAAKKDRNLSAFLSFSPVYRWEIDEDENGYEVRFIDLRYRSKGYYPFVAVVKLNRELKILSSYTGWIYSEKRLQKKLDFAMD
jgi:inner membrane protein